MHKADIVAPGNIANPIFMSLDCVNIHESIVFEDPEFHEAVATTAHKSLRRESELLLINLRRHMFLA